MKIRARIELDVEVDVDYEPGRKSLSTRNPSSPGYSNPGDDEYAEINSIHFVTLKDGKKTLVPVPEDLLAQVGDTIIEDVYEACRNDYQSSVSEMLVYQMEEGHE